MCCHNGKGIEFKTIQTSIYESFSSGSSEHGLRVLREILSAKDVEQACERLKLESNHDAELLVLLSHIDQSPAAKLALLGVKEDEILERTRQNTGQVYAETARQENKGLLAEAQESDAQDFFNSLGTER